MDDLKQPTNFHTDTKDLHQQQTIEIPGTSESSLAEQPTIAGNPNSPSKDSLQALPKLPGYTIEEILGRGGMGVVYRAQQRPLNRPVALKMILSGEHAGAEDRLRFLGEAESIAKIQHPGIVQLYEFGSHEGHPYFALEYVTGGTLEQKLSGTPLPAREAAALVEKLARAMKAAHDLGIVHRDLKPANVLLTQAGEPKITDFGLAKTGGSNLTATGAILGTPSYMAPEQADGRKDVGTPTDIYALGAILYECLTGRPPFKAATHLDTILQVVNNEPVSVRNLQVTTPQDLETICHKCLAKDPEKRYASMGLLAEDLRRYLHNEPIDARPVGRLEKTWRWCRRNPLVAGLSGSIALLLLGVAFSSLLISLYVQQQNSDLENANDVSRRNEEKAHSAAEEAKQERDKSKSLLSKQYAINASRAMDDGDHASALVWTSEAIKASSDDPAKVQVHRLQLNELLKQQAVPIGIWESEYSYSNLGADVNEKRTYFSKNGKLALIPAQDQFEIMDLQQGTSLRLPDLPSGVSVQEVLMTPDGDLVVALCTIKDQLDTQLLFSLAYHDTWNGMLTSLTKAIGHLCSHSFLIAWEPSSARIVYKKLIAPSQDIIEILYKGGSRMKMEPTGKRLLVNQTLIEVSTGNTLNTIDVPSISQCYFNQDGTKIIIIQQKRLHTQFFSSHLSTTIWHARIWNIQQSCWDSSEVKLPGYVSDGGFNSNGKPLIAVMCSEGSISSMYAEVWDIKENQKIAGPLDCKNVDQARQQLDTVRFGPEFNHVIVKYHFGYFVWDLISKKQIHREGSEEIRTILSNFSRPTNELIIAADSQGGVSIRNLSNNRLACPSIQMKNLLTLCQFTPDGEQILVGTKDGRLELYGIKKQVYQDGDPQFNKTWIKVQYHRIAVFQHMGEIHDAAIDPKGKHLLTSWKTPEGKSAFTLWRINSPPAIISKTAPHMEFIPHASFSEDRQYLVMSGPGKVQLYQCYFDSRKITEKATYAVEGFARSLISSDNRFCLVATNPIVNRTYSNSRVDVTLHQLPQFHSPQTLFGASIGVVFDLGFSPDSRRCAAVIGSAVNEREMKYSLHIWDTHTGKPICVSVPKEHRGGHSSLVFSKNSQKLTHLYDYNTIGTGIDVYGAEDGVLISSFHGLYSLSKLICNHRPSEYIVSSPDSYLMKATYVLDINNPNSLIWQTDIDVNHAQFSLDGLRLATASGSQGGFYGEARIWHAHTGRPLSPAMLHQSPVQRVHLFNDDKYLLSVSGDNQYGNKQYLCLWDVQTGMKLLPPWPIESPVVDIAFDTPSRSLLLILMDGSMLNWKVNSCDLASADIDKWTRTITGRKLDDTGVPSYVPISEYASLIRNARKNYPELLAGSVSDQVAWNEARLSKSQDYNEMKILLDELIKLEPNLAQHRIRSAEVHEQLELHREAIQDYAWLCEHEPKESLHWIKRGIYYARTLYLANHEKQPIEAYRNFDEGIRYLQLAMQLGTLPKDTFGQIHELDWYILMDSSAGNERWQHAVKLEQAMAEVEPGYRTTEVMALALFRSGKYQEALETVEKSTSEFRMNEGGQSFHAQCLMCLANPLQLPMIWAWGTFHPHDLIIKAMIEHKMGKTDAANKTRRLLGTIMVRPEYKDSDVKELDQMLSQPSKQ